MQQTPAVQATIRHPSQSQLVLQQLVLLLLLLLLLAFGPYAVHNGGALPHAPGA
jgi:hypothetical protein